MKTSLVLILIFYVMSFLAAVFYVFSKKGEAARFSSLALYAGLLLHTIILFYQGYLSGRLPVAGVFETLFFYSWAVSGVVAVVGWRYNERLSGLIMMPLSITAFVFSFLNMTGPKKLPLILRTYWFELHVITSFAAYALFTLALSSAVFFIIRSYWQGRGTHPRGTHAEHGSGSEGTPSTTFVTKAGCIKKAFVSEVVLGARDFLDITGRAILFGFFFFSVSMFSGAIWGYVAWGAYWMWEPKMLWSFIVWFWYAGAMHLWYMKVTPRPTPLRGTHSESGSGAPKGGSGGIIERNGLWISVAAVMGFFITLFTYIGVGLLMKSSHSF
ncbi:MAG: cytochrome c biogenesis protein CcsA [Thermodesulfobacteriota bacterium]